MKALTLHQPYASLIALHVKWIETRSWSTPYRGPIAIHAAKRFAPGSILRSPQVGGCNFGNGTRYIVKREMPLGAIVATAALVDVVPIVPARRTWREMYSRSWVRGGRGDEDNDSLGLFSLNEQDLLERQDVTDQRPYGDFSTDGKQRFAWLLEDVKATTEPVPCRGNQGLWTLPPEIVERLAG